MHYKWDFMEALKDLDSTKLYTFKLPHPVMSFKNPNLGKKLHIGPVCPL